MKYMIAALTGRWIVNVEWLLQCEAQSTRVNEEDYGVRLEVSPLKGKRIAITKAFSEVWRREGMS